mmetsp:Transcript_453/g.1249  ORF Transcript_453/g.1249 Transcript_453/m.1249 type:complete len:222 (+) Transcript_453:172-837(+)
MQEHPGAPGDLASSIQSISDQRMALMSHMRAYLVHPSGVEPNFHQADIIASRTYKVAHCQELRLRRPSGWVHAAPGQHGPLDLQQRRPQQPPALRQPPRRRADVALAHAAGGELQARQEEPAVALGPEQRTRGVTVKPVNEPMRRTRIVHNWMSAKLPSEPPSHLQEARGIFAWITVITLLIVSRVSRLAICTRSSCSPAWRLPQHANSPLLDDHVWFRRL